MTASNNLTIYYFTGSGNSGNVAKWLSEVAIENEVECQLINIAKTDRKNIEKPSPTSTIVFVSPIHGFNYPPVMLNFIIRFPKGKNKVVLMNTRAGMLIGNFITPGITGIAFYLTSLIMILKGYTIQALFPVDLPSNWISLHPGLNDHTVRFMHEKIKIKITAFGRKIISGKTDFIALFEIWDIFLLPISLGYYFVGRFMFAKTFYASSDCNNCDICVKGCPVKAIIKVDKRPFWTFNCESCMKCMGACPKRAIETAHGFIIGYIVFLSPLLLILFYKYYNLYFPRVENGLLKMVVESALFLLFLAVFHRIIHYLMRFRFVERLMVYTSLTKLKWWGRRYKALKDI
jgi:Pyruvate/2-oxoacid:ferredoxin oxidoreductase delta subunit